MLNNSNRAKSPKDKNWCISLGIKDKLSYVIIHRYTVTKKALGQGKNANFFDFFWYFWNYYSKINGKMPRERVKAWYDSEWGPGGIHNVISRYIEASHILTYHVIWYLCHPFGWLFWLFWYFWNYYIKINGKMPRKRGKARYASEGVIYNVISRYI